jgi:hypothetical protein
VRTLLPQLHRHLKDSLFAAMIGSPRALEPSMLSAGGIIMLSNSSS